MNALQIQPTHGSSPSSKTSLTLSPGLKSLLDFEPSDDRAARQISETFRDEAQAALPALREIAVASAGEGGVKRVIAPRFALFPQPVRSPAEWGAWWADYIDALEDLPEGALEAGMQAWVKQLDAEFLPRPGKLRELALKSPNKAARAYQRALNGVNYCPPERYLAAPAEPVPPKTRDPAERESVKELMADFTAQMTAKRPPVAAAKNFPPPPTDENGVTEQMRRHMRAS